MLPSDPESAGNPPPERDTTIPLSYEDKNSPLPARQAASSKSLQKWRRDVGLLLGSTVAASAGVAYLATHHTPSPKAKEAIILDEAPAEIEAQKENAKAILFQQLSIYFTADSNIQKQIRITLIHNFSALFKKTNLLANMKSDDFRIKPAPYTTGAFDNRGNIQCAYHFPNGKEIDFTIDFVKEEITINPQK